MNKYLRIATIVSIVTTLTGCAAAVIGGGAAGVGVAHDRRTTGTFIEDKEIYVRSINYRNADEEISKNSDIEITAYNMQVLLTGQSQSQELVARLQQKIETIPRVRKVINEVSIGAQTTLSENASDTYLTGHVKIALFDVEIEGFDPSRIKVTSSLGTVYLMGIVSRAEGDAATEVVRFVSGVKRVVKLFEYND